MLWKKSKSNPNKREIVGYIWKSRGVCNFRNTSIQVLVLYIIRILLLPSLLLAFLSIGPLSGRLLSHASKVNATSSRPTFYQHSNSWKRFQQKTWPVFTDQSLWSGDGIHWLIKPGSLLTPGATDWIRSRRTTWTKRRREEVPKRTIGGMYDRQAKTIEALYPFDSSVITKYHKLGGLNIRNILFQFWRLEV